MAGRAKSLSWRGEAAPLQAGQNGTIDIRHDSRRAHIFAGAPDHDPVSLGEMLLCTRKGWRTGPRQRRMGENSARLLLANACRAKILARQIETADGGVLIEIAQNIGELQRPAEVMREKVPLRLGHSKS